jgi:BirA family transcriptional regulator, biotin operon repressor / biotin---[acetyl-CoA-carboxylase] ligase
LDTIYNTLFIGKFHERHEQLASTNLYALELLSKSKPSEGMVVSVSRQYDGRGQIGSSWESEPQKNVTMSVILYPTWLALHQQFSFNQCISLAVRDFVQACLPQKKVEIKWSNDIYIEHRKVAGILIQNTLNGANFQASVVGIGLNVNQTIFLSNAPNPTSLALESGSEYPIEDCISTLCSSIEFYYLQLKSGNVKAIHEKYLSFLYQKNKKCLYERTADKSIFRGTIVGISSQGKLEIYHGEAIESFDVKEVRFL